MRAPPRVLVVSADQWPRALLRAELRNAGYDAIGASTLARALRHPPTDADRGPVRLIIVDDQAATADPASLERARRHYPGVLLVLVHRPRVTPAGPWAARLPRPVAIGEIVAAARRLAPPSREGSLLG